MGLMYNITHWLDHVTQFPGRRSMTENADGTVTLTRAEGEIIQQGTPRNATHYNNMETGILASNVFAQWLWTLVLQHRQKLEDLTGEYGEITLTNTKEYPFTNAIKTIPLTTLRSTTEYNVAVEVVSASGGLVEYAEAYDRQLNGFKIRFTGSARSATLKYCVTGGKVL